MTRFCSKSFFKILNKRAMKHKIWWYHWISRWILNMIKFKNLFLTEKITKLWPFSQETSILINWVWCLFGCLFVHVTKEKAYNLVSFSARKMFLYFFLHRIQWGIQWNHQILSFTTALLRKRLKTNCNMLWNFENFLKSKSSISHLF